MVVGSIEVIGGLPPYTGSIAGAPNDFSGCLDIVTTDSTEVLNLVLNANGAASFPDGIPITGQIPLSGQVTIIDVLRRSVTFGAFTIILGPDSIPDETVAAISILHSAG